ncbi:Transcriptional regulator, histidine kinase sensor [Thermodesulfobium narugense DSM 14796]|uniref:Transcriptional regulator, histidine kinase sensor n=1 Tax=Thermodesulfobium narugense DSM 14796 TaxID=747365 RepID=M1E7Q0_9BACT|nr:PocR ligand-binding domain-containing protein [Thermodesulfobium narugense]AEE14570.1 Transcriptional regulator, histidine kinase sensor [Thermodesulfobium narugense DSM 14796]
MEITDVIPMSELRKLVEEIYEKFGFTGVVYKPDNFILVRSKEMGNALCPYIKDNSNSLMICSVAQQILGKDAFDSRETVINECDAEMVKFVIPIFVGSEFLGTIGGCGRLADDKDSVETFYISKLTGIDESEIKELAKTIKKISKDEMNEVISFIRNRIKPYIEQFTKTLKEIK